MKRAMLVKMLEEFTLNEVKPLAHELDQDERFPSETVEKLAQYNLMGLPFDRKYGGAGAPYGAYVDTVRILSQQCATTGVILSAHTSLCASPY